MIIFERLGGWGLGNSLFQIATTIAIARDNNVSYAFPNNCNFKNFNRLSQFKNEFPWVDISTIKNPSRWGTGDIRYVAPPNPVTGDLIIDGFFQSELYFKHHREAILEVFAIKDDLQASLRSTYANILNDNSCVISFRRGVDYYTANELRILDIAYYKSALSKFDENTLFVIFSDNIEWCKEHLFFIKNKVFVTTGSILLDMHLMSYFSNNIIANSTFSWWGAWLGDKNKRVYMPSPSNNWFSDLYYFKNKWHHGFQSLACENWIIL